MFSSTKSSNNDSNNDDKDSNNKTSSSSTTALKFDVQEFYDLNEDEIVDFETSEEFLLHFSRTGQLLLVKKLLQLNCNKEILLNIDCKGTSKSNYGWSALHLATYFGHLDVVELLLKFGANVNIQNEDGDTPLHKASYTGRENILILLLKFNANVFLKNDNGFKPIDLSKNDQIKNLLLAAEKSDILKKEEKLLSSARCGDLSTIKKLFEDTNNPININCIDQFGNSALHCAASRGQYEIVLFLLKNGIDCSIKNKNGQLAANVANTISLKQLIQEAHVSLMTPKIVQTLKNKSVKRFESFLLKKGRFFGWKLVWAVLERGIFSFYNNRLDAQNGLRRKGYKYLENAIVEVLPNSTNNDDNNIDDTRKQLTFVIIFGDRSRAMFALPKDKTELHLQLWINAINEHIYFSTNFIKQGTNLNDSDDDDNEALDLKISPTTIKEMILTANAHQKILERHIESLQQLLDDDSLFTTERTKTPTTGGDIETLCNDSIHSYNSIDSISKSTIPSIKFHLNLIVESSKNANNSLNQCLMMVKHQNENRQNLIEQQKDKVRVLEEALQMLAKEHHDLQCSISKSIAQDSLADYSISLNNNNLSPQQQQQLNNISLSKQNLSKSFACLSLSSNTDIDEYFDAFDDDAFDDDEENFCDNNNLIVSNPLSSTDLQLINLNQQKTINSTFHTAQSEQQNNNNNNTINDSITTLSPDDYDGDDQKTIASDDYDNDFKFPTRTNLPSPMVPRDEIGLWSILKHCIGKELSKITFPVIFNEPLSFLQRMTEIFQFSNYLNIADQCDDIVERMENICAFIVSAYSSNWLRLNKPFNPLLGETFEYEIESSQTKIVLEQVSHHPPISAWYAESPHYILHGTSAPKLKFWGKSIEVKPEGTMTLKLKNKNEIYTWKSVNCCVHNIIVGKLWFEQYGTIEVLNKMNDFRMIINFKPAGWFGYDLNRFDGFIQNSQKEKLRFLYGKWNDYLKSANMDDYDEYLKLNNNKFRVPDKPLENLDGNSSGGTSTSSKVISKLNSFTKQFTTTSIGSNTNDTNLNLETTEIPSPENLPPEDNNGDIPKSDSSHSLDINNSRILWKALPRPENSAQYYHFNSFTFGLNQLPEDKDLLNKLPCTDSRFRPDIRKLEEGDLDAAAAEKNRLEEKQRETRRLRKKGKMKEFEALWFRPELNKYTGTEDWFFTNKYWNRDWSNCPDIF